MRRSTLLVLSQVYVPDPTSVGQHMHDTCAEMVRRGHRVVVLTSARGYENAEIQYARHEIRDGVEIRRLGLSSFGKRNLLFRLAGQLMFLAQCIVRALLMRDADGLLVSTSPPMASAAGLVVSFLNRVPLLFWVHDLNPDQAVAVGALKPTSPFVRLFDVFNRMVLRRAAVVVTCDRFMADRLLRKVDISEKLHILPPWAHEAHLESVSHHENPFRETHRLNGHIVFMYSGNHSTFTPLRTILDAALELRDDPRFKFVFIGGGTGKPEVDQTIAEHQPPNMLSLPYQPLDQIKYSLSAADVHLVALGDVEVGVRHPCKIYGSLALNRPVMFLGPQQCHIGELIAEHDIGWQVAHGDVAGATAIIRSIGNAPSQQIESMGATARRLIDAGLGQEALCGRLCDLLEQHMNPTEQPRAPRKALKVAL